MMGETIRIACICNMTNSFFSLVRYLRDYGFDAELLLFKNEFDHFRPDADSFRGDNWDYIKTLPWSNLPTDLMVNTKTQIREIIRDFDYIIGCGAVPAYLHKAGRKLNMMIPYGRDIYGIPFNNNRKVPIKKLIRYYNFARHQFRGIRNTEVVVMDYTNPEYEKMIQPLRLDGQRLYIPCPFIYEPQYNPSTIRQSYLKSTWYPVFKRIRDENDLVVFHHCRHEWDGVNTYAVDEGAWSKGNDKLIKGFAAFLQSQQQCRAKLILFEYGRCVDRSKRLIDELGIGEYVQWLPILPRKEIMIGISLSDVGVGELATSYLSYGVVYEFLAMGIPVIHYREDAMYENYYPELYPMINANSTIQVTDALCKIIRDPDKYRKMGDDARKWLKKYAIDKPLQEYLNIIRGHRVASPTARKR